MNLGNSIHKNKTFVILQKVCLFLTFVIVWFVLAQMGFFPPSLFPSPLDVGKGFLEEIQSGRMVTDLVVSLFRISCGFFLAVSTAVPLGLYLGQNQKLRDILLPYINFFRNLSTLAWIPFAVMWFGIGDIPVIFLIFIGGFFPLLLNVISAVLQIPKVYFQVAIDYKIRGPSLLWEIVWPAIIPQVITGLRMTVALSWIVLVAAEMIAGQNGLGFAIFDARNGLRSDLLVAEMLVIGLLGVVIDIFFLKLMKTRRLRWAYE